jgi:hypothetical protein
MKARFLTTAVLAIGIFATSGALRAQQGSITFTFGDRDRQAMREWYRDHYNAQEFQSQRRWNGQWEQRIQAGVVLDPQLRAWVRPVPRDLYGRLSPLPRGYRYVIVSDHVVVVDDGWMIHDVNHFERFENSDQQVTRDWYRDHRDDGAFEGRRHWNDRFEQRIQVGATLDPDLRRMARPVPVDLLGQLPRRPRGMRYVMIGDHACLIDKWWTVRYVMHLEQQ